VKKALKSLELVRAIKRPMQADFNLKATALGY